jgi:hypothetical protein
VNLSVFASFSFARCAWEYDILQRLVCDRLLLLLKQKTPLMLRQHLQQHSARMQASGALIPAPRQAPLRLSHKRRALSRRRSSTYLLFAS